MSVANCIVRNGKSEITDFSDLTNRRAWVSLTSGKLMNTKEMRLVRRVTGRRGSLSLYRFRQGLAEVLKVSEKDTDVIEIRQHKLNVLEPLLDYMDDVQGEIDALIQTADKSKQGTDAHGSATLKRNTD
jgi:hypothetical protein